MKLKLKRRQFFQLMVAGATVVGFGRSMAAGATVAGFGRSNETISTLR